MYHLLFIPAIISIISTIFIYLWFKRKFSYWKRKGVPGPKPSFPFGNVRDVIKRKKQIFQPYCDAYFQYKKNPMVGLYCFNIPVLCINDLELAKHILIKDYDYFQSHGVFSSSETSDPLGGHLFHIHGPKWKSLRSKLSPTFSPANLKSLFPHVKKAAEEGLEYGDLMYENGTPINFTEFFGKYVVEIVGNVGFGIKNDGFKRGETEFHGRCRQFFEYTSIYWTIIRGIAFFAPEFFKKFGLKRTDPVINNFFYNLVKNGVEFRKTNNYRRKDFLQRLIDLMDTDSSHQSEAADSHSFTLIDVVANTMLYLFAGYETSATTGRYAAYELAKNPDVQSKAREEILRVLAKYNGQCTYEAQNEMTYMNMVLEETLRKYPPLRALFRRCNEDYKVPNTDIVIDKGTLLFIPIQAIQMDPEIFEDPEKFDPERFTPEKKATMHPCQWMPFGEGPKKCLGVRQGYIQSKMALVQLLSKYELCLNEKTENPLKVNPSAFSYSPLGGIWINLKRIDQTS
ncbi:probable cytochrome P450 6a14 [Pieris napi]|uniref:probable cytochrome P450 6a14 n=1 Tax=Pieris napi TaxID=78633 RepID=UPI001FBBDC9E|nr:probable cytochrome P450 6a14 [Pieris napi]